MSKIIRSECSKVALPDPPEVVNANPIHDEKAGGYGYAGPIVAGIHTYGWMVPAILDAAGDSWLSHGWADINSPDQYLLVMSFTPKSFLTPQTQA